MKLPVLASLLVLAACASSPYERPYSLIVVDPAPSADPNVIPVFINRVDDRNSLYPDRAVVPPGHHMVTVDVPPRQGFHLPTQSTFEMNTQPCTRYYISARLDTPVTQEWKPVVRSTEPIGECLSKFNIAGTR
jgi:hypothetical protein